VADAGDCEQSQSPQTYDLSGGTVHNSDRRLLTQCVLNGRKTCRDSQSLWDHARELPIIHAVCYSFGESTQPTRKTGGKWQNGGVANARCREIGS